MACQHDARERCVVRIIVVFDAALCRDVIACSGAYYHMSGDVYEGEFADNEYEGFGTYRCSNGSFVSGKLMITMVLATSSKY
jgi:hypothetical protein